MEARDLKIGDVFTKIGYAEFETIETRRHLFGSSYMSFMRGRVFTVLEASWEIDFSNQRLIVQDSDGSRMTIRLTTNSPFNTLFEHFFRML